MNKKVNTKSLGVIVSLISLLAVASGFVWLYFSSEKTASDLVVVDNVYLPVEIDSIKQEAENLIKNKENNSGMPIKSPTADLVGRDDPFAGL